MIKVFNKITTNIEAIDIKDLDKNIHLHRNTHKSFTEEEIKDFWYKSKETKKEELKPKENIVETINIKDIKLKLKEKWIKFFPWAKDEKILELAKENGII